MAAWNQTVRALILGWAAVAAGAVLPSHAHQTPGWEAYYNEAFEFGVSIPEGLLVRRDAGETAQGLTLTSDDGRVVMNVFGAENPEHRALREIVAQYRRSLPDARITYEWLGRSAAVLSGYQNGDILYVRIAMSPDRSRVAVLNMLYARDLKRELDPVVTRLSHSLAFR